MYLVFFPFPPEVVCVGADDFSRSNDLMCFSLLFFSVLVPLLLAILSIFPRQALFERMVDRVGLPWTSAFCFFFLFCPCRNGCIPVLPHTPLPTTVCSPPIDFCVVFTTSPPPPQSSPSSSRSDPIPTLNSFPLGVQETVMLFFHESQWFSLLPTPEPVADFPSSPRPAPTGCRVCSSPNRLAWVDRVIWGFSPSLPPFFSQTRQSSAFGGLTACAAPYLGSRGRVFSFANSYFPSLRLGRSLVSDAAHYAQVCLDQGPGGSFLSGRTF